VDLGLTLLFVVLAAAAIMLQYTHERRTEVRATGHLQTMLMLRESVLRSYFESLRSEVALWSSRAAVIDIFDHLNSIASSSGDAALRAVGSMETREISSMSQRRANTSLDQRVREFAEHHGYYDVFFIGTGGDVLFTMAREADYGTNLLTGPYARTGLGHLFQRLAQVEGDGIAFEDFSLYPPSNDQPAAFLGARVYANEEWIGIYAIQIPESPINEVMQFSAGMGTSGETYLVAADGLMRSTSRFFDQSTVLRTRVEGPTVDRALAGSIGLEIVDDYRGVPVYSAYRRFEFEGVHWAVLAEQDVAEIQAPLIQLRWWLTAGLLLLALMMVLLRFMLTRIVLPSSIAALLGLSFVLDAHD
jgi:hypothetical protein